MWAHGPHSLEITLEEPPITDLLLIPSFPRYIDLVLETVIIELNIENGMISCIIGSQYQFYSFHIILIILQIFR